MATCILVTCNFSVSFGGKNVCIKPKMAKENDRPYSTLFYSKLLFLKSIIELMHQALCWFRKRLERDKKIHYYRTNVYLNATWTLLWTLFPELSDSNKKHFSADRIAFCFIKHKHLLVRRSVRRY